MSREQWFGEVRSLLSRGESKQTWEALCDWVDRFDDVELEQIVFPYVEGHVRGWDAALCMAPKPWVQRALAGESIPFWGMVRGLDLSYEYLDAHTLWRLLKGAYMSKVEVLNLQSNRIGESGVVDLARHESLRRVRVLDLGFNTIRGGGVKSLAEGENFSNLEALYLERNALGSSGAIYLAGAAWLNRLRALDLTGNEVNEIGVKVLLKELAKEGARRIERLVLDGNRCRGAMDGLFELGKWCTSLRELELRSCELGAEECRMMGAAGKWESLERLDLSRNKEVDNATLKELIHPGSFPKLKRLYLGATSVKGGVFRVLESLPSLEYVEVPNDTSLGDGAYDFRVVYGR